MVLAQAKPPSISDTSLLDIRTTVLVGCVLLILVGLSIAGRVLKHRAESWGDPSIIRTFNNRVTAWLTIFVILSISMVLDRWVTVVFFFLISFWALREFITMTTTRRGDHRTLFWVFFLFTPIQYIMVAYDWYAVYSILIPVYGSLFIPGRIAFSGDTKRFLERTAKIQFGLLICVYALSHAPALLFLKLEQWVPGSATRIPWEGKPAGLLVFLISMVQLSDMLVFAWDRMIGKHVIAPSVNNTRTWEGLIGAACCTGLAGMLIQLTLPVTPFTWYGAGAMALLISIMGSSGKMTMSAIKRDRGIRDYGTLVQGHAGVLDRIDSVCFAAPIFFHVIRLVLERADTPASAEPVTATIRHFFLG